MRGIPERDGSTRGPRPAVVVLTAMCISLAVALLAAVPALAVKEYVQGPSFGGAGAEPGQLKEPTGVAANDSTGLEVTAGDVYVVDRGNNRVERFSATGTYKGQFDGSGEFEVEGKKEKGTTAPTGTFSTPEEVAVDNSGKSTLEDPSVGDVYVVDSMHHVIDKFTAKGEYVSQLTETTAGSSFGELHGVAVDSGGNLLVYDALGNVDEFSNTGSFIKAFNTGRGSQIGLAVDSRDDVYVTCCGERVGKWSLATGKAIEEEFAGEGTTGLAINPATDNLLVDKANSVAVFGPFGEPYSAPLGVLPGEGLSESHGIAVGAGGTAYATELGADRVETFEYLLFPDVRVEPPDVTEAGVTLRGSVNPEGEAITECQFEYGLAQAESGHYEHNAPCVPPVPAGNGTVHVSAEIAGLESHKNYHYRLTVRSNRTKSSPEATFFTSTRPAIEGEAVSRILPTEAMLSGHINAAGLQTTYRVDYGTSTSYGASTAEVSLGAPQEATQVQSRLGALLPNTVYHFRIVATNSLGTTNGQDVTFTTLAVGGSAAVLPDSRAYELVSGLGAPDAYVPDSAAVIRGKEDVPTEYPFRSSANGDALVYVALPGSSGGNGNVSEKLGNQYLATRSATEGWQAANISPEAAGPGEGESGIAYEFFSSDLSVGVLTTGVARQFAISATPQGPTECAGLYTRTSTGYHALFDVHFSQTPSPLACGQVRGTGGEAKSQTMMFVGASADYAHLAFQTPAALKTGTQEVSGGEGNNLYDSTEGQLAVVNVLADGSEPEAVYGGPSESGAEAPGNFGNVISRDGSKIFWTDLVTHRIYVREGATLESARTTPVSGETGPAQYWTATPDGRYVYYTENGELWRFDTASDTREALTSTGLNGENAEVQGAIGTSDDGAYVYFVAGAVLTGNPNDRGEVATPRVCEQAGGSELIGRLPPGKGCNLYVLRAGHDVSYIAALAAKDDRLYGRKGNEEGKTLVGDWRPYLGARTAEVTPDGRHLVFMSTQQLTGYDNHILDENSPHLGGEVFVYFADSQATGRLYCASCSPAGAAPEIEEAEGKVSGGGSYLPASLNPAFMSRWISQDGERVFFDSSQPLAPQDKNRVQDVYEWEREGHGTCLQQPIPRPGGGCVSLLSGGNSSDYSYFLDADAEGGNVFFTHRGQLGQAESGESLSVFDARVNGGFPFSSLACTGTGCQGVPPVVPSFATPPSVTFSGVGNFGHATPAPPRPRTAAQIRAEHLALAVRKCRKVHDRHKRAACERLARKRYGTPHMPATRSRNVSSHRRQAP